MSYEILDWVEQPKGTLALGSVDRLQDFEMTVIETMHPDMTSEELAMWMSQTALTHLIRPKGFHGQMGQVRLDALDDPYDRLMDARERGKRFGVGRGYIRKDERTIDASIEHAANNTRGYALTAHTIGAHKRTTGTIDTEVFYVPAPPRQLASNKVYFSPLRRFVTIPEFTKLSPPPKESTQASAPTSADPYQWLTEARSNF